MLHVDFIRFATPRTMTADAYREFCWGAGLPETLAGYGLLYVHDDDGKSLTAVLDDVEYARLLTEAGDVKIPADKVTVTIAKLPDLAPSAASVWE